LEAVRAVSGVRDVQWRRTMSVPVQVQGAWRTAVLFAVEDLRDVRIGTLRGAGGAWPVPDGTIAIEHSSVAFAGTGVGDSVLIAGADSMLHTVPVAGVVRDVGLAPGWMEHVVYAWTSTRTLAQLGAPYEGNELRVVLRDAQATRTDARRIAALVRRAILARGGAVGEIDVPEPGEHVHAAQMDSLLLTQGAFGVLALLVAGLLVVNFMTAILAREVRAIGVMKSLGADDAQMTRMYLVFAAALGVAATVVALPVTVILGRRYAGVRAEMLNFPIDGVPMPWWSIASVALVGVVLPVMAAWQPVRRAVRLSVADALRDLGLRDVTRSDGRVPLRTTRSGTRVLLLAVRNAFRRRQRLVLTTLTLASGGALFMASRTLRQSVLDSLDLLYASQRYDISVRLAEPLDADRVEAVVRGVAGVRAAEAWSGARGTVMLGDVDGESISIVAAPSQTTLLTLPVAGSAPPDDPSAAALVLTDALARQLGDVAVGARLVLAIDGVRSTWLVRAVMAGGPTPMAYTTTDALARVRGDARRRFIMIAADVRGVASQVELIQRVRTVLADRGIAVASTQRVEEARRVTEDHLLMVVQFLTAMGWVMLVVGGMSLASTMGLAVLERTRELAIMRALGAGHATIAGMIQLEGATIAVLGWSAAIPLSSPIGAALGVMFSRIMLRVPVRWLPEPSGVLLWLGLALVVVAVACAWPAWRALRIPVARALHYE
ncbi:MAG: ABC transporter permease, partial [Gemmatimonadaceae bacterium]|nr:ABC transporter permease [Gemmatimonadaceae bacterium]